MSKASYLRTVKNNKDKISELDSRLKQVSSCTKKTYTLQAKVFIAAAIIACLSVALMYNPSTITGFFSYEETKKIQLELNQSINTTTVLKLDALNVTNITSLKVDMIIPAQEYVKVELQYNGVSYLVYQAKQSKHNHITGNVILAKNGTNETNEFIKDENFIQGKPLIEEENAAKDNETKSYNKTQEQNSEGSKENSDEEVFDLEYDENSTQNVSENRTADQVINISDNINNTSLNTSNSSEVNESYENNTMHLNNSLNATNATINLSNTTIATEFLEHINTSNSTNESVNESNNSSKSHNASKMNSTQEKFNETKKPMNLTQNDSQINDTKKLTNEVIQIIDACVETCSVPLMEKPILIITTNSTILLQHITYTKNEVVEFEESFKEIESITSYSNQTIIINASKYFAAGKSAIYDITSVSDLETQVLQDVIIINPRKIGSWRVQLYAVVDDIYKSNWFNITVINQTISNDVVNLSNVTNTSINYTDEFNETVVQKQARVGIPVQWEKIVITQKPTKVSLPQQASNIKVRTKKDKKIRILTEEEITISQQNNLMNLQDWNEHKTRQKKKIKEATQISVTDDEEENISLQLREKNLTQYTITYETPAPVAQEKSISTTKKRIHISSPFHYKNIIAQTTLPTQAPKEAISIDWLQENETKEMSNVTYLDEDLNGLIDTVEWLVPHLSNQTFEVSITILTVKSYPSVGGFWLAKFNTTGAANLTIQGANGTVFGAAYPDDLTPIQLMCGNQDIGFTWNGSTQVSFENYSCPHQSTWKVQVHTKGAHTQEFTFGSMKGYAHNNAGVWWNTSFSRCKTISITNAGSTDLTNFPAYINVTYDNNMQADFDDVRFVNASCKNGGTTIEYEAEKITNSDRAHYWVKIPSLPAAGKDISMYYGNSTVSSIENERAVWDNNFLTVQHLEEDPGPGAGNAIGDSGPNQNNGTADTEMESNDLVPALVGDGYIFNGVTDNVRISNGAIMNPGTGPFTVEGWYNSDSINQFGAIASKFTSTNNQVGLFMCSTTPCASSGQSISGQYRSSGSHREAISTQADNADGNWHYAVLLVNSSNATLYLDFALGTKILNDGTPDVSNGADWYIGTADGSNFNFEGIIDEIRISNVSRSVDWLNQTYLMMKEQNNYVAFQSEITQSGVPQYANFNASQTTDFTTESDLGSVPNANLQNNVYVKLSWKNNVNATNMDFDSDIPFGRGWVLVNAENLHSTFNSSTNISFFRMPSQERPIILRNGVTCPTNICHFISYTSGTFLFNVTGFSNYSLVNNSALHIWDESDAQGGSVSKFAGDDVKFTANYSNVSDNTPITGGGTTCTLVIPGFSNASMTYNSTTLNYEHTRMFTLSNTYQYSIHCDGSSIDAEELTLSDNIQIFKSINASLISPPHLTSDPNTNIKFTSNASTGVGVGNVTLWSDQNGTWSKLETRYPPEFNVSSPNLIALFRFNNESNVGENITTVFDWSGSENNATCSAATCPSVNFSNPLLGGSRYFDGTNDYLSVSALDADIDGNNGTIALWVRRDFADTTTQNKTIAMFFADASNYIIISYRSNGDTWQFIRNAAGNQRTIERPATEIPQNQWTFVALTWETGIDELRAYINAEQKGATKNLLSPFSGTPTSEIGRNTTSAYFQGQIGELAVWNERLNQSEISDLYNYTDDVFYPVWKNYTYGSGTYIWNTFAYDVLGNSRWAKSNFTFSTIVPYPCDLGNFVTTCYISTPKGANVSQWDFTNLVLQNGGSLYNATEIALKINATGNITLQSGSLINLSLPHSSGSNLRPAGNLSIESQWLLLESGATLQVSGADLTASETFKAGDGGKIEIATTGVRLQGDIIVDGGSHSGGTNSGSGGNAGSITINSTQGISPLSGNLYARGGGADTDTCTATTGVNGNGGPVSVLASSALFNITGSILADRGSGGFCNDGNGSDIYLNFSWINVSSTISSKGEAAGDITLQTSSGLIASSTINSTSDASGANGTLTLWYGTSIDITAALLGQNPFITKSNAQGKLSYLEAMNSYTTADFTRIILNSNLVSVNVDGATVLNKSANLWLYTLGYTFKPVIWRNSKICSGAFCDTINYSGGNLRFNVTSFSNYSTTQNSNLSVDDNSDINDEIGQTVTFYANYTNITSDEMIRAARLAWVVGDIDSTDNSDSFDFFDYHRDNIADQVAVGTAQAGRKTAAFWTENNSEIWGTSSPFTAAQINSLDLDGDGHAEVVASTSDGLHVITRTGLTDWSKGGSDPFGDHILVDLNNDSQYEVVAYYGSLDNVNAYNESGISVWNYSFISSGSANELISGDLDRDGIENEIFGVAFSTFFALDDNGSLLFSNQTTTRPDSAEILDLDKDGFRDEVLIYEDAGDLLVAFIWNGTRDALYNQTNAIWTKSLPSGDVTEIAAADLDDDGFRDDFVVADSANQRILAYTNNSNNIWNYSFGSSSESVDSILVDDIDGDGEDEIVFGTTTNNPGTVFALNRSGGLIWSHAIGQGDIGSDEGKQRGIKSTALNATSTKLFGAVSNNGYVHGYEGTPCRIQYNDSSLWFSMQWDSSIGSFIHRRSFSQISTYSFNVSCNGSLGYFEPAWTTQTFTIINITNDPPDNPTPQINSTDGTNRSNQALWCNDVITDQEGDAMNFTALWFRNGAKFAKLWYNNSYANGSSVSSSISSTDTTKGENWICSMRTYDGELFSDWVNTTALTVLNTGPAAPDQDYPNDGDNLFTDRTPRFNWTYFDEDGDTLNYTLTLSLNADFSSFVVNATDITNNYYDQLSELDFTQYFWRVRAFDGQYLSPWSETDNFTLVKSVVITLVNDTVDFGSLFPNDVDDTTDNAPFPLHIRNDGNFWADLVNASTNQSLFNTVGLGTSNWQFKIDNASGESSAFDWAASDTDWVNISTANVSLIHDLNHTDTKDEAEIDIRLEVPSLELPGSRKSFILLTWEESP